MKRLKKILALALATAMVLSMTALSAFAAYTYTPVEAGATYDDQTEYFTDQEGTAYTGGEDGFEDAIASGLFTRTGEADEPVVDDPAPATPDNTKGSIELLQEPAAFKDAHTYNVYQIFTGNLVDGKLTNVKYGANYGSTGSSVPKTELDAIGTTDANARAFADDLMANNHAKLSGDPVAQLTADNFKAENLTPGYYLIVDTINGTLANGDAMAQYIVQVLGHVSIDTKKDVTEGGKKITSDDHPASEGGDANPGLSADGKTDNVSVGDKVNFEITSKVPSHATDYDYYFFIINDTLSDGLTLDPTFTVTASTKGALNSPADYVLYLADKYDTGNAYNTPDGSYTFQIALQDAKALAGQTITVTYSATLNKDAVIGDIGNPNTQNVKYSNNPNEKYEGEKDEQNPGKPKSTSTKPFGVTPDSVTKTYTSGIKLQKLDQDGLALKGASFTIEGDSINQVVKNSETFVAGDGEYWKLKTGAYTTDAPVTADYMEAITGAEVGDDGYVLWQTGDEEEKVTINSVDYRVVRANEAPTHILVKKNDMLYDSTETKYTKTSTETVESTTSHVSQNLPVNDDGTLNLEGLGAGTYTIKETVVPSGYTKASDTTVVITFDNTEKKFTATVNGTAVNADATTNLFPMDVINVAGNTLPSTGGIGTTIFYVVGAILVIGAGVVLITKRRMEA